MKIVKQAMVLGVVVLVSGIMALVIFYGNIAVAVLAAFSDTQISYKQVTPCSINELMLKDLSIIRRKDGKGLSSASGSIKFLIITDRSSALAVDFALNDVRFIRKGDEKEASLNSIDGLISAPFSGMCKYNTISGKISNMKNGFRIRDLMAASDTMKFSFDGTLTDDNSIDASIVIYFADKITGKMPAELSNMILRGDLQGWRSLSLKIKGDLSKPSINVTGKTFRLNIGLKS